MNERQHAHSVQVSHRILTQEVECDHGVFLDPDVLDAKRAAADRVSFVLTLFVAHTQSENIDQVGADTELVVDDIDRIHLLNVVVANLCDLVLEATRLLVLLLVVVSFDFRFCGKCNVFSE